MLTSTLSTNTDFTTAFDQAMIKGQNVFNFTVYFLIDNQLVTKTTKWTKAQINSTNGKGGTTRWKLNGNAIAKAELNEILKKHHSQEVRYSAKAHELKADIVK